MIKLTHAELSAKQDWNTSQKPSLQPWKVLKTDNEPKYLFRNKCFKIILQADDPHCSDDTVFKCQNYFFRDDMGMNNPKVKLASECTSIWCIILI